VSPRGGGRTVGAGIAVASQRAPDDRRPELDPGLAGQQDRPVSSVDNGFAAGYRVRFDEAGADGLMRTSSLLRYAQDIAWRHSEDLGFDRSWYTERGRWWVVRSVELDVLAPVAMGRTLRVATAVIGHRRIWARRRGEFRFADGTLAAVASTDWVIIDERGRILRIPGDFGTAFPNVELDVEIIRVVPPPPPSDATRLGLRVRPQDLDPMGHVNNAVYLDWVEEAVLEAGDPAAATAIPRRVAIEYAASAEPGDALDAVAWPADGGWWVRLTRPADGSIVLRARLGADPG
jgi:acyl-ACP thioesterase